MNSNASILLFLSVVSLRSRALPTCVPRQDLMKPLFDVGDIYQRSAQTDEPDRKSAQDFGAAHGMSAAQVEKKFAATGDFICPKATGQAQVTVRGDVVTTAAHLIYPKHNCDDVVPFKDCRLQLNVNGKMQAYRFKAIVKSGITCPAASEFKHQDDWIVLRLEKTVDPRVKPYAISTGTSAKLNPDQKIITVAKSYDWPDTGRAFIRDRPRHYAECEIKKLPDEPLQLLQTNCDTSSGSSGGSVLTTDGDPLLLGIVSGQLKPGQRPNCAERPAQSGPYQADCWGSAAVAVDGAFRSAILEAAGIKETAPQSEPNTAPTTGFKLPGLRL